MSNVGLVGCGVIGSALARALQRAPLAKGFRLVAVHDVHPAHAQRLVATLRRPVPILSLAMLIRRSDLVIEATSAAAAGAIVTQALSAGRQVMALSVGGLLPLQARLPKLLRHGGRLDIPTGAIAGLDAIKAARCGRLRRVTLTTRKPPKALQGAPGIRRPERLRSLKQPVTIFQGTARRAVKAFPQNINVAATLALAGLGAARTQVRIVADPAVHRNVHEIEAVGSFGRLFVRTENIPSAQNPRTSELAILSAQATLQQLASPWRVGT